MQKCFSEQWGVGVGVGLKGMKGGGEWGERRVGKEMTGRMDGGYGYGDRGCVGGRGKKKRDGVLDSTYGFFEREVLL